MPPARKQKKVSSKMPYTVPGPKMGPRPEDFDEALVRKSPTFRKWIDLTQGSTLTYASRTFIKGSEKDEERLMRRIMIARRNNLKEHEMFKKARATETTCLSQEVSTDTHSLERKGESQQEGNGESQQSDESQVDSPKTSLTIKRRRVSAKLRPSDEETMKEMDVAAVEATRSYRKWLGLSHGEKMVYNQTYIKGDAHHEWQLKKNIWRRMRYRRENHKKVKEFQSKDQWVSWTMMNESSDDTRIIVKDEGISSENLVDAAVAAAASVAASFEPVTAIDAEAVAALSVDSVKDPLVSSALDAAAQLATSVIPLSFKIDVNVEESFYEV